jgi:hypothetical protein
MVLAPNSKVTFCNPANMGANVQITDCNPMPLPVLGLEIYDYLYLSEISVKKLTQ